MCVCVTLDYDTRKGTMRRIKKRSSESREGEKRVTENRKEANEGGETQGELYKAEE